jgi:hypothetical protein
MRNEFEGEVQDLLKRTFPVVERYDDVAFNRLGGRQVKQKPYDFFGCTLHGRFFAVEVKRVKSHLFPLRNFKEHQHEGLARVASYDAWSWVFVNWRHNWRNSEIDDWSGRTGVAIWVHYGLFKLKCDEVLAAGRKSLKPSDFPQEYWLERITGGWEAGVGHAYRNFVLEMRNLPLDHDADLRIFEERLTYGHPVRPTRAQA